MKTAKFPNVTTPNPSDDVATTTTIKFDAKNIWRIGFVVMGLVAIWLVLRFVLDDGGNVIFTLLMAWFGSIAIEPLVGRLAKKMKRGFATGIVMLGIGIFAIVFMYLFGSLFVTQVAQLIDAIPSLIDSVLAWANEKMGTQYAVGDILQQFNLEPSKLAQYGTQIVGGVLGVLMGLLGGVFSLFTFALFMFYFSADGPRLRRYIASFFPQKAQPMALSIWDLTAQKTGGYVGARLILAFINASTTAIVFWIIGMPSWLALALWTGIVAQFVPTIGTYIAIALPTVVGLLSGNPWIGVIALGWGILYQQIENLTIEPKISAKAVDVHPAFAFAVVMLGAALFGVAGALLAVPVGAMLMALLDITRKRYEIRGDLESGNPMLSEEEQDISPTK